MTYISYVKDICCMSEISGIQVLNMGGFYVLLLQDQYVSTQDQNPLAISEANMFITGGKTGSSFPSLKAVEHVWGLQK